MKTHFKLSGPYAPTFKEICDTAGNETAGEIQSAADKLYMGYLPKHSDLSSAAMMHWKQCCERAALYQATKEMFPDKALDWIELSSRTHGEQIGTSINKTLKIPGMKHLFIPMMKKISGMMFGVKAGFENSLVSYDRKSIRFDILRCPYCQYLAELGCPELTESFCKSDEYAYGCLDAMVFRRTQTLGTGGEKCDFYMAERDYEKEKQS